MAVGSPFAKQMGKLRLRNEVCEESGKDRQQTVVQLGLETAGVSSVTLWKSTKKKSLFGGKGSRGTGSVQGYRNQSTVHLGIFSVLVLLYYFLRSNLTLYLNSAICHVAQACLKREISLPKPPKVWPPCLAHERDFKNTLKKRQLYHKGWDLRDLC